MPFIRLYNTAFIAAVFMVPAFIMPAAAQECLFTRQSVNMKIEKRHMFISGMYFISAEAGSENEVTFPFPSGPLFGGIDSVHIYNVSGDNEIEPEQIGRKDMRFPVKVDHTGGALVQVYYTLTLLGNKAVYPFSQNALQGETLEKACFYLIAPASMGMEHSNYKLKDTINAGENMVYVWEMYDFCPKEDLVVRFENME